MSDESSEKDAAPDKADDAVPPPPHHEEEFTATTHAVVINGEQVDYTATTGRMLLREEDGKKKASFFYVAYTRDNGDEVADRPLTFAFNGGPGSSSVWLHLGAFGPRRVDLQEDGMPLPPPGRLIDNEHSILDATDLVFIDPVGTGFSRAIPGDDEKEFHHFKKDIEAVGEFIRVYLTRHGRWASPKFLAGESYGTTRSAGLAGHLFRRHGMYFNGLMLISSVLNFQTVGFDRNTGTFARGNDLPYVLFLPTYAAAAWYHGRVAEQFRSLALADFIAEVEQFAATEYTLALQEGADLTPERSAAIANRLADYTGLSIDYLTRYNLRIEILRFCKELLRDESRTIGRIDARFKGIDRFVDGDAFEADPSLDAVLGTYTSALNDYLRRELDYDSDLPYEVMNEKVWQNWDYEDFKNAYVDVSETLREVMSRNPFMKVFVANGYLDLATPHFATEYTVSHMGLDPEVRPNLTMAYYEAGHMMYVHQPSLAALAADLRAFISSAV
jgi:carboxypeptidase C (cathepsin A)